SLCRQLSRQDRRSPSRLTPVSNRHRVRRSLPKFETGGGATGTIRPSTSPRMPTSGFEDRGGHLSPCTSVRDVVKGRRRSSVGGRPSACNRRCAPPVSRRGTE